MKHWIQQINQTTDNFTETFGELSQEQLNWKPDKETWSIAQNIHHLIIMNESYFVKIKGLKNEINKLPFYARFEFIARLLGKSIKNYSLPDRKKRTKTFDIWQPSSNNFPPTILTDFKNHQEEFKGHIEQSKPFIEQGAIIPSPATSSLFYKLDDAFDIIVTHEERHFCQANEVFEKMKKVYN